MITKYICEICHRRYDNKNEALVCESRGRVDPKIYPPIGLIAGTRCGPKRNHDCDHHCRGGFVWVVQHVGINLCNQHSARVGFGIFRGNGCGDSFNFTDAEGGYGTYNIGPDEYRQKEIKHDVWVHDPTLWTVADWPEAKPCPAFSRAVKALRAAGIQPRVVRKGKIVRVRR